jgi:hypothetical protein
VGDGLTDLHVEMLIKEDADGLRREAAGEVAADQQGQRGEDAAAPQDSSHRHCQGAEPGDDRHHAGVHAPDRGNRHQIALFIGA